MVQEVHQQVVVQVVVQLIYFMVQIVLQFLLQLQVVQVDHILENVGQELVLVDMVVLVVLGQLEN
jgi:hypothetical protein